MTRRVKALYEKRDLLAAIVSRNLKVRYKQSVLGFLWAFLQPVIYTALLVMVQRFTHIQSDDIPYPIFVFSAMLPWAFFSNAILYSATSILDNAPVIKKIACPRELFPLASVLSSLFDFLAAALIYAGLMFFYATPVTALLFLLPVLLLLQLLLAFGIGLIFSSLAAYRRDVIIGLPFLMQFWMLGSPVMYPLSSVPDQWLSLYLANPMAGYIAAYRSILLQGNLPPGNVLFSSLIGTVVVLVAGQMLFDKLEKRFADVI